MGKKDYSEKSLIGQNDVFADIVNYYVFDGVKTIDVTRMTDVGTESLYFSFVQDEKCKMSSDGTDNYYGRNQASDTCLSESEEILKQILKNEESGLENEGSTTKNESDSTNNSGGAGAYDCMKQVVGPDDIRIRNQVRNLAKRCEISPGQSIFVGIELQTGEDPDLPFRTISYDGAMYRSQMYYVKADGKRVLNRQRYPVLTIALYFGEKPMPSRITIKECLKKNYRLLSGKKTALPDSVARVFEYIQDYGIWILDVRRIPFEHVHMFKSDFRHVVDYFIHSNEENYVPDIANIIHIDEFPLFMSAVSGDMRYANSIALITQEDRKRGVNMCKVLDYHEELGRKRGLEEGLKEGLKEGRKEATVSFVKKMIEKVGFDREKACDLAGISPEEYEKMIREA